MHLFKPLALGHTRVANRIVMTALPSGHTTSDGFVTPSLAAYYAERARGGVGMLVLEAAYPLPPATPVAHLGLYDDTQVPGLRDCIAGARRYGPPVLAMIDQPQPVLDLPAEALEAVVSAWAQAAWRAHAAEADGVMFSCANGGPLEQLISPGLNQRSDQYGGNLQGRIRLLFEMIERVRHWLGTRLLIGVRLNIGEFAPSGLPLHDARVVAKRLASAGVDLLEISGEVGDDAAVARFPGWLVPLAESIKAVTDLSVMVGGLLADAELADRVIGDGSADLVALGESLRAEPRWPEYARSALSDP